MLGRAVARKADVASFDNIAAARIDFNAVVTEPIDDEIANRRTAARNFQTINARTRSRTIQFHARRAARVAVDGDGLRNRRQSCRANRNGWCAAAQIKFNRIRVGVRVRRVDGFAQGAIRRVARAVIRVEIGIDGECAGRRECAACLNRVRLHPKNDNSKKQGSEKN